jgi:hypothetical protein
VVGFFPHFNRVEGDVFDELSHQHHVDAVGINLRQHAPKAKDFTNKKGCRSRPLTDEDRGKNRPIGSFGIEFLNF